MVSYEALIRFTTNWWGWRDQDESDIGCLINRFYRAYWGACVQHRQRQIRNDVEVNGSGLPRFFFSSHIRVFWHFNIGTKSATKSGKQRRRAICADLSLGGEYITVKLPKEKQWYWKLSYWNVSVSGTFHFKQVTRVVRNFDCYRRKVMCLVVSVRPQ